MDDAGREGRDAVARCGFQGPPKSRREDGKAELSGPSLYGMRCVTPWPSGARFHYQIELLVYK